MLDPATGSKHTDAGRDMWSRTGGFARFLTTDSSESRFDAAAHLDWYPRYLAWALVFGSAEAWAKRFQAQGVELPAVPWIYWTGTQQGFYQSSDLELVRLGHLQRQRHLCRIAVVLGWRRRVLGRIRWRWRRRGLVVSAPW